jgi:hypothetical protein
MYFPGQYNKNPGRVSARRLKAKQQTTTSVSTTFHNRSIDMRTENTNINTRAATPASNNKYEDNEYASKTADPLRRSANV